MKTHPRYLVVFLILILCSYDGHTQTGRMDIDSLKEVVSTHVDDTNMVNTLFRLSVYYRWYHPDSSFDYAHQALALSERLNFEKGVFWSLTAICGASILVGDYPRELEYAFKALALSKKLNQPRMTGYANGMFSEYYFNLGEYETSMRYWREVMKIIERWFSYEEYVSWGSLSRIFEAMGQPDSAMLYAKKAYKKIRSDQSLNKYWHPRQMALIYLCLGNAFAGTAGYDSALYYYRKSLALSVGNEWNVHAIDNYNGIANVHKATGSLDSAEFYAKMVLTRRIAGSYPVSALKAATLLSEVYELGNNPDSTLKYLRMGIEFKEQLFNREKIMAIQDIHYREQERGREIAEAKSRLRNQFMIAFFLVVFVAAFIVVVISFKNSRRRQLQTMRNSIADDLHDDIGSTLSSISIMSELAKSKSSGASDILSSISESTIAMQENMSDIVWAIKSENDRFENVLRRMNEFASEILDAKGIDLDFSSVEFPGTPRLSMSHRKNMYLVFKEVINNAAKYSNASKVTVHVSQKRHHVEMVIEDDGVGFDPNVAFQGNGMTTLKRRGEELNAEFNIQSRVNGGTVVQLRFGI